MSNISNATNATAQPSFNFTELSNSFITTITNIPSNITNVFTSTQVQLQDSFNGQYKNSSVEHFVDSVRNNESLNSIKDAVVNNSMVLGGTGSFVGGYITSDAINKLNRQDKGTSIKREVVKLAVGAGMIAASQMLSPSSDLDKVSLTVCALSGALLHAEWKAATTPVTHHFYVLKASV